MQSKHLACFAQRASLPLQSSLSLVLPVPGSTASLLQRQLQWTKGGDVQLLLYCQQNGDRGSLGQPALSQTSPFSSNQEA